MKNILKRGATLLAVVAIVVAMLPMAMLGAQKKFIKGDGPAASEIGNGETLSSGTKITYKEGDEAKGFQVVIDSGEPISKPKEGWMIEPGKTYVVSNIKPGSATIELTSQSTPTVNKDFYVGDEKLEVGSVVDAGSTIVFKDDTTQKEFQYKIDNGAEERSDVNGYIATNNYSVTKIDKGGPAANNPKIELTTMVKFVTGYGTAPVAKLLEHKNGDKGYYFVEYPGELTYDGLDFVAWCSDENLENELEPEDENSKDNGTALLGAQEGLANPPEARQILKLGTERISTLYAKWKVKVTAPTAEENLVYSIDGLQPLAEEAAVDNDFASNFTIKYAMVIKPAEGHAEPPALESDEWKEFDELETTYDAGTYCLFYKAFKKDGNVKGSDREELGEDIVINKKAVDENDFVYVDETVKFDGTKKAADVEMNEAYEVEKDNIVLTYTLNGESVDKPEIPGTYKVYANLEDVDYTNLTPAEGAVLVGELTIANIKFKPGSENQVYTIGVDETLVIETDGPFGHFLGIKVDDLELEEGDYTAEEGSTKVTLKKDYLERISEGKYDIEFIYLTDGGQQVSAKTSFTTANKPETGDSNKMVIWIVFAVLAEIMIIGVAYAYFKEKLN